MNLIAINFTIQALCEEMINLEKTNISWQNCTEDELLYEVAFCIFSSQMLYEVAIAAADRLRGLHLLSHDRLDLLFLDSMYEEMVRGAFVDPLHIEVNGVERMVKLRFRNRLSALLTGTIKNIYGTESSIRRVLIAAVSAQHARELLVRAVVGFGPKQASLFLRRIGYCSELAVLDTHVVDYLKLANGTEIKQSFLSRLPSYEMIEDEFRKIAKGFGYTVGCVDLAMWITMRVAKRGVGV